MQEDLLINMLGKGHNLFSLMRLPTKLNSLSMGIRTLVAVMLSVFITSLDRYLCCPSLAFHHWRGSMLSRIFSIIPHSLLPGNFCLDIACYESPSLPSVSRIPSKNLPSFLFLAGCSAVSCWSLLTVFRLLCASNRSRSSIFTAKCICPTQGMWKVHVFHCLDSVAAIFNS